MSQTRCLILACGNSLRSDDGVGPWLAEWAEKEFGARTEVRIIAQQQWTPDLAADLAGAENCIFVDCALDLAPGEIRLVPVVARVPEAGLATHHTSAEELLKLAESLYGERPNKALLLSVGAESIALGESFSGSVLAALPDACSMLLDLVNHFLGTDLLE